MPWEIKKQGERYCVVKKGSGETVKCHPMRADAVKHLRALYANVPEARGK